MVAKDSRVVRLTIGGQPRVFVDVAETMTPEEAHELADAIREAAGLPSSCPLELMQAVSRLRRRIGFGGTNSIYSLEGEGSRIRIEVLGAKGLPRSIIGEADSIAALVKMLDEVQRIDP